jgi:hypothetical protein
MSEQASKRSAAAAEGQLEAMKAAAQFAESESGIANERASAADSRGELAQEQMKAALRPILMMIRVQDTLQGQRVLPAE